MHEMFAVLNACGSQAEFDAGGGFMHSVHVLCVSGANLRHGVKDLEIIRQVSAHPLRLGGLDELRHR